HEAKAHLAKVDAVMIGRAAYENPWVFGRADSVIFGVDDPARDRSEAALAVVPFLAQVVESGVKAHHVTRHLLGLFHATPVSRAWKHGLAMVGAMGRDAPKGLEALVARTRLHSDTAALSR
ncbi:MAG TPA: tRNA-dihydrouridine synthase, partial [Myxococcota bacterium]|nr:tRNA-dihydrouridine synthase [Myxococcota bacterium]